MTGLEWEGSWWVMNVLILLFAGWLGFLAMSVVGVAAPEDVRVLRDVAYVEGGHERQKLDLYLPAVEGPAPLLVWVHGGGWAEGSKDGCPAVAMTAKGWVVASINYRLSQHAVFPAQIEDCKAALRFLRANAANYRIDKERVAAWGASAGGHLVALLGVTGGTKEFDVGAHLDQSSSVSCVINWFGPTDFLNWGRRSVIQSDDRSNVIARLFGGPVGEKESLARKASPVTWVNAGSAPMLLMHGDRDLLVPLRQSELLEQALRKAGVPCVLKVYPGQGHGGPRFTDAAARSLMVEFVTRHTGRKGGAAE